MTPKEKAIELFDKMNNVVGGGNYDAKQYALIAVDEILNYIGEEDCVYPSTQFEYWQEVRKEINKL